MKDRRTLSYNVAVIPTILQKVDTDDAPLALNLLDQLMEQGQTDEVFVFDNTADQRVAEMCDGFYSPGWLRVVNARGLTLHQMWNQGMEIAHVLSGYKGQTNLAILNDDIILPEDFIKHLDAGLRGFDERIWCVYPDWHRPHDQCAMSTPAEVTPTSGTQRKHGMSGWAFMLAAEHLTVEVPLINWEKYKWWCGDDEIEYHVRKAGGIVGRVDGLGLTHLVSASVGSSRDDIGRQDLVRFQEEYGY